jgi:uncharacterized protein YcgL (UPF0745 family)
LREPAELSQVPERVALFEIPEMVALFERLGRVALSNSAIERIGHSCGENTMYLFLPCQRTKKEKESPDFRLISFARMGLLFEWNGTQTTNELYL